MIIKGSPRTRLLVMLLFLIMIAGFIVSRAPSVNCPEEYLYYGIVPGNIRYATPRVELHGSIDITAGWSLVYEGNQAYLVITALKDGTNVRVSTLEDMRTIFDGVLRALEFQIFPLPNGTSFKVTSDNPVSVILISEAGELPATFYTAMDSSYVGKEFVLLAPPGYTEVPYRTIALEGSRITVYKDDGSTHMSFGLSANEYRDLPLSSGSDDVKGFRLVSTGNIMIQTGAPGARGDSSHLSFAVPSAKGGFVGYVFYADSSDDWDATEECGFRISALETTKVIIWDIQYKRVVQQLEVKAGTGTTVKPKADVIMVESNRPVTCSFIHSGSIRRSYGWSYGEGVTYIGVKLNEKTMFYLPEESNVEAYIFAYENTEVKIDDDSPVSIAADSYLLLNEPGTHSIQTDKNVVIEVTHWPLTPSIQGILGFGVVIPSIQSVNITPNVLLTPIKEEGLPLTYIVIGTSIAIIIAASGYVVMKRRPKYQSTHF